MSPLVLAVVLIPLRSKVCFQLPSGNFPSESYLLIFFLIVILEVVLMELATSHQHSRVIFPSLFLFAPTTRHLTLLLLKLQTCPLDLGWECQLLC